jgi:hypothetical protein
MGRIPTFVTVTDFSASGTCYAEPNSQLRRPADTAAGLETTKSRHQPSGYDKVRTTCLY